MNKAFHRHVANLIEDGDISQAELAARLDVSPSYISKLKRGLVPPDEFLVGLAAVLELQVDQRDLLVALAAQSRAARGDVDRSGREGSTHIGASPGASSEPDDDKKRDAFRNVVRRLLRSIGYVDSPAPETIASAITFHGETRGPLALSTEHMWVYCAWPSADGEIRAPELGPFADAARWLRANNDSRRSDRFVVVCSDTTRLATKSTKMLRDAGVEILSLGDLYRFVIDLEPYFEKVIQGIVSKEIHSDLRAPSGRSGSLDSYYQVLNGLRYKQGADRPVAEPSIAAADDWLNTGSSPVLMLTGEPGSGKTTLAERLTTRWLTAFRQNPLHRIPIFISLEGFRKAADFSSFLVKTLIDAGVLFVSEQTLRLCDSQGMFVFVLDAMDEMIGEIELKRIKQAVDDIDLWIHPATKMLVTCRTEYFVTAIQAAGGRARLSGQSILHGERLHLQGLPLDVETNSPSREIASVVNKRLGDPNRLLPFLALHSALLELATRPLFLDFLIEIAEDTNAAADFSADSKGTESRIFNKIVARYLDREISEKDSLLMPAEKKVAVAEDLALEMRHQKRSTRWTFEDIVEILRRHYSDDQYRLDERDLSHYAREFVLSMFLTQEADGYRFSDDTLQDFFCARRVHRALQANSPEQRLLERIRLTKRVVTLSVDLLGSTHVDLLLTWLRMTRSVRGTALGANCLELLVGLAYLPPDLSGVDVAEATLAGVLFGTTDLRGSTTLGTDLARTNLCQADLRQTLIDDHTFFEHAVTDDQTLMSDAVRRKIAADAGTPRLNNQVPEGMAYIAAGELPLTVGGPTVPIRAFFMDRHPVTNEQYADFLREEPEWTRAKAQEKYRNVWGGWRYYLADWRDGAPPLRKGDHPVVYVPYAAAEAYAAWKTKKLSAETGRQIDMRLPSVREWEWAASGGRTTRRFPWDVAPSTKLANYNSVIGGTTAVASYPPNEFGLYDVVGNVWEWCSDYVDAGEAVEEIGERKRIRKGGGFNASMAEITIAYKDDAIPEGNTNQDHGFRCVADIPPDAGEVH